MKITWLFLIKAIAKFKWGWYERIGPSKLYCHILRIKSRAIKFKERVGWVTKSDVRLGPWFLNKIPIWLKSFSYILELYLSHSSDAKRDGITSRDPINLGAKFKTQKAGRDIFNSFMLDSSVQNIYKKYSSDFLIWKRLHEFAWSVILLGLLLLLKHALFCALHSVWFVGQIGLISTIYKVDFPFLLVFSRDPFWSNFYSILR